MFIIFSLAAAICAALAWRARRWRRAGDHPHCRRCDFDLTGLPAGTGRCPECGADLAAPRATAIGARRPARFVVVVAAVAAVACLGVALFTGARVNWVGLRVRHSPTGWLIRDVAGPWGPLPAAAATELERRLYDDATDLPTRVAIVRAMRRDGVTARPIVRAGDVLPLGLKLDGLPAAGAIPTGTAYEFQAMCVGASIVGGPNLPTGSNSASRYPLSLRGVTFDRRLTVPPDAATGPATVRVICEYRLVRGKADDRLDLRRHAAEAHPEAKYDVRKHPCVARWDEAYELPVTVLAADATDDVTFVPAAKAGVDLTTFVKPPKEVLINPIGPLGYYAWARVDWIFPTRLPVGVACEVVLRDAAGAEVPIGTLTCPPNRASYTGSYSGPGPGRVPALDAWTAERADVVLRPSASVARTMMATSPVLADEVVFKDVPVRLPKARAGK